MFLTQIYILSVIHRGAVLTNCIYNWGARHIERLGSAVKKKPNQILRAQNQFVECQHQQIVSLYVIY